MLLILTISNVVLVLIVGYLGYLRVRAGLILEREREKIERLSAELLEIRALYEKEGASNDELTKRVVQLEAEKKSFEYSQKAMYMEFENLANKILESNTNKFRERSLSDLSTLLDPLKVKIAEFEKRIEDSFSVDIKERYSLSREIARMASQTEKMIDEASKLSKSLRGDNKAQGLWGELVLSKILEHSGLQKDRDYTLQQKLGNSSIPDVIINLPDEKHLVIDAKTSLKHYDLYVQTNEKEHLELFLKSIRSHIKNLAGKEYHAAHELFTPGFVFMFVPIESAYMLALSSDSELKELALRNRVMLVSPNSLIAMLQAVSSVWKIVDQNKNANEIAKKAGAMYDKFVLFVEELVKVGNAIAHSDRLYKSAINKLRDGRGSLFKRAEDLKMMGISANKELKDNQFHAEPE
ncbi:rmuC family protein [Neorickettsia helminthoeca str. Oregon]|uniref:DNA recombination protein RmuC homolog n=1 Tax=Neorickettsia helminthoeca str. Oregon TaxID=1286528 RepID=X5H327_9RICK|nr:DNA recombination protein RmuC [Neorickettsia helminthoeca]AHX11083.1 rmuC family protein [Neorickettsia helminthoeca str. Oregon]